MLPEGGERELSTTIEGKGGGLKRYDIVGRKRGSSFISGRRGEKRKNVESPRKKEEIESLYRGKKGRGVISRSGEKRGASITLEKGDLVFVSGSAKARRKGKKRQTTMWCEGKHCEKKQQKSAFLLFIKGGAGGFLSCSV